MSNQITHITVRGYHLDLYGHVNNSRYLEFLEEARWQMFEKQLESGTFHEQGLQCVIVNININYRRPAVLGEILEIKSEYKKIGNRSITLNQTIRLKGKDTVIADADVTYVLFSQKEHRAIEITDDMRQSIQIN
jgi:thioesterase-3